MLTPTKSTSIEEETTIAMSYEEFLVWVDENTHAEWSEGVVTLFMPPKYKHQDIISFLLNLIRSYADLFNLGTVQTAPFEVKLWEGGPSREPDLLDSS